jgi:large subunit ribosomal protein L21
MASLYAVIEESGGQRKIQQDDVILVDLLDPTDAAPGRTVTFDRVLVVGEPGGGAKVGQPYVAGASVTAEVVDPVVKGEKLRIQKFKPKTGYSRRTGHRQRYTRVRIVSIAG